MPQFAATQTSSSPAIGRRMVDLFAGCGGLSLGFEEAGFAPVFVNELNDDARSTYLSNRRHLLDGRPFNTIPDLVTSDIHSVDSARVDKLKSDLAALLPSLSFGREGTLDVVAGGPPCQGYSGIGHRRSYHVDKVDLPSNQLYQRMAFVIESLKPRVFLFENVKGLLSARWTASGSKGEIWKDVFGRFRDLGDQHGYQVRWALVHAKNYGVPQNRPRVLICGIRNDIADAASHFIDVKADAESAIKCNFLPALGFRRVPDLIDLLSDLEDPLVARALNSQDFGKDFATRKYLHPARNDVQKHFRPDAMAKQGASLSDQEYSRHAARIVAKFQAMIATGGEIPLEFQTKKFAQRVLPERWGNKDPYITATSMPDDYVHYRQPRILTVREWARLQTFPDWYQFDGKRTTGGLRRAGNPQEGLHDREVPKYTQIGNAVPVWLAEAVGRHFSTILAEAGV